MPRRSTDGPGTPVVLRGRRAAGRRRETVPERVGTCFAGPKHAGRRLDCDEALRPAHDEAALGEHGQVVFEGREVAGLQVLDRHAVGPAAAQPAAQRRRADAIGRLGGQREQDREFRPVVELVGDDRQRVDGEHLAQLVVGEAKALHERDGERVHAQNSWFSETGRIAGRLAVRAGFVAAGGGLRTARDRGRVQRQCSAAYRTIR